MLRPAVKMATLRTGAALWVALSFFLLRLFSAGVVGYTSHWEDGKGYVAAGSHPVLLAWAIGSIALLVLLFRIRAEEIPAGVPSGWRRIVAFLIDFWFSLAILASFGGIIPLWLESLRTGHFAWSFKRDFTVPNDSIIFLLVLTTLGLMFLYFVWPLTKGKQTVGYFILRLRVAPPFGTRGAFTFPQAARRVWLAFTGIGLSVLRRGDRDSEGRTWYGRETGSTVILIRYE